MAVSRASEVDAGVTSYCDRQDVRTVLLRIAADEDDTTLGAWASKAEVNKFIDLYLEPTRLDLEDMSARDWGYHTDVEVQVSGLGTEMLDLGHFGFWPLIDVTALSIGTTTEDVDDYVWDASGLVLPDEYYGGYPIFPRGNYNINATIDYGYSTVPADVKLAHAEMVACIILPILQASNATDPGGAGGVQRIQYQDMQVTNFQQGRYAPTIKALKEHVRSVTQRYRNLKTALAKPRIDVNLAATTLAQFGWNED